MNAEQRILYTLATAPDAPLFGLQIVERAKVSRGSVYIHLSDLEERGQVKSEVSPTDRYGRRVYRITPNGRSRLREVEAGGFAPRLLDAFGMIVCVRCRKAPRFDYFGLCQDCHR